MEEFILTNTEIILRYKKNIFKQSNAFEFVQKLTLRKDENQIRKELEKCLLPESLKNEGTKEERKKYIDNFILELNKLKKKEEEKSQIKKREKTLEESLMPKINDENFPTLQSLELVENAKKKKFKILDKHYNNKLEKGFFNCFCYGEKHPLIGNCLFCGRIHCLQEGDKVCINCGNKLINNNDNYLKSIVNDLNAKNAYSHKEKLLKFQEDFYSKLQIIDEYNDWYEISTNTWLADNERQKAKKRDKDNEVTEIHF